ncbi:MAG: SOS response-associated peptidase [Propionibacteriaceae bacterium]|jgi:putative SOS response-associated peptidase YedK|nr:SOS response-associated peptidase [Propionibacteriaceae bacterium]
MCGRFVLARADADLVPLFDVDEVDSGLPGPSHNIAPSEPIRLVAESAKEGHAGRRLAAARWGLVPAWYASPGAGPTPFNARIEKLTTSGMYRGAFARRRGVVPADGFFERSREGRRPSYYVTPEDGSALALAALYEWWRDRTRPDDDPAAWLLSATVVTHPAQLAMVPVHDREPLYLAPDLVADWLDPGAPGTPALLAAVEQASAAVAAGLEFRPVSAAWLPTTPGKKRDDATLIA